MVAKAMAYVGAVGLLVAATLGVLWLGSARGGEAGGPPAVAHGVASAAAGATGAPEPAGVDPLAVLRGNLEHPLPLLLLQIVVIVLAARGLGSLFRRLGQPAVIGEILAGILLGPSLLGWLWPASQALLFPPESLEPLRLLSQLGVILFMFVVGLELDVDLLRRRLGSAVFVSHVSIVAPFFLGTALALLVYRDLAPAGTPFTAFALFLGVAMSITAFPVLARILEERGLARTALGSTAIACAAVDDVTAWCLLAVVVAIVKAQALSGALLTVLLSGAFVALVLGVVKPRAARLVPVEVGSEGRARALLAGSVAFLLLCALATETLGIHALFGAFLAGVAMPRHRSVVAFLEKRLEAFSSVFLLPLFFAFTGLRTEIGLLADWRGWLLCAGVVAVAVAGKLGGSMLAARATGMPWTESFALGALMNTRGLIELVVLNLGYDLGILSPRIFVMLVLMALVTTAMTGPLLQVHAALRRRAGAAEAPASAAA
jgi:Kef-type K+ transport system membrane component KefB